MAVGTEEGDTWHFTERLAKARRVMKLTKVKNQSLKLALDKQNFVLLNGLSKRSYLSKTESVI